MRAPTLLAVHLLVGVAGVPVLARAGDPVDLDPAAAQELFDEGRLLARRGDWEPACAKFEESQRLDPGIGTGFNLADCNERRGRLATAWAQFLAVAAAARSGAQPAREREARARAAALEPKLSRVKFRVPAGEPGLQIFRDDMVIGMAQWGSAIPVDSGEHSFVATAPGKTTWRAVVRLGQEEVRVVEVPPLEALTEPLITVADAPPPRALRRDGASGYRTAGLVTVGAVGVASLGVGVAFGLVSRGKHDDAVGHCLGNVCDPAGLSLRDDARTTGTASSVAFGVCAAALVGVAVIWLTAPSPAVAQKIRGEW